MEKTQLTSQTSLMVILLVGFFFVILGYTNSKKTLIIKVTLSVIEMKPSFL